MKRHKKLIRSSGDFLLYLIHYDTSWAATESWSTVMKIGFGLINQVRSSALTPVAAVPTLNRHSEVETITQPIPS